MADFKWYGVTGQNGISDWHKIWIIQNDVGVCGYLGEGTSREIVSNYDTPFSDSSLESKFRLAGGLVQVYGVGGVEAGHTSQTKLNSRQVWTGNQPYTFNLVMKFRAFSDAYVEVEQAIEALEMMMAPDLKLGGIVGTDIASLLIPSWNSRVPLPVTINIGRRAMLQNCCIRSMSTPFDKEKDQRGNLIRADVSLQVETLESVTKADLQEAYKTTSGT